MENRGGLAVQAEVSCATRHKGHAAGLGTRKRSEEIFG
jgi:hypothetical protein